MNEAWLLGSHMGRFSWKDLVWWVKKICYLLVWKSAHECLNMCFFFFFFHNSERDRMDSSGESRVHPAYTHTCSHIHRETHTYVLTYILHMHQLWAERMVDDRKRSLWTLVASTQCAAPWSVTISCYTHTALPHCYCLRYAYRNLQAIKVISSYLHCTLLHL